MVLDTGAGTANTCAYGIYASDNTDVRGNSVDAVVGTVGSNVTVYGIYLNNSEGVSSADNVIRNLEPSGSGLVMGGYSFGGQKIFADNNRVSLPSAVTGSVGYRCNSSTAQCVAIHPGDSRR